MEGVIATVLLIGSGLTTLQTASVITGLPFAIVLLISIYSIYIGFVQEIDVENAAKKAVDSAKDEHELLGVVSDVVQNEISDNRRSKKIELNGVHEMNRCFSI